MKRRQPAKLPDCRPSRTLLQQLQNLLLYAVRLRQGTDAGLAQNLELRQVAGGLTVVGRTDAAFGRGEIDALRAGDVRGCAQLVDPGADGSALSRNTGDRVRNISQRGLGQ